MSADSSSMKYSLMNPMERARTQILASVWDEEDPKSVIRLATPEFRESMLQIPEHERHTEENELRKIVKPSPMMNQLRLTFWLEYHRAAMEGDSICLANAYRGVCTKQAFIEVYRNKNKLRWVLCPPQNYEARLQESLDYGLNQLRDILAFDCFDGKGRLNTKLLEMKLKITMYLDARINGPLKQRVEIEQKSANINIELNPFDNKTLGVNTASVREALARGDMAALDAELRAMEHKLGSPGGSAVNKPHPKDTRNMGGNRFVNKDIPVDFEPIDEREEKIQVDEVFVAPSENMGENGFKSEIRDNGGDY